MNLGAQAFELAVAARNKVANDPLELFRDDMLRAAKQGFFSVSVDLSRHARIAPRSFFLNAEVQNWIGETLAAQGIAVSFGEPLTVDAYPSCKVNWYKTRRVVKWSKVVRQEKAAEQYGVTLQLGSGSNGALKQLEAGPSQQEQQPAQQRSGPIGLIESEEDEDDAKAAVGSANYEDKVSAAGVKNFEPRGTVVAMHELRKIRRSEDKKAKEEELISRSKDAVVARAAELKTKE